MANKVKQQLPIDTPAIDLLLQNNDKLKSAILSKTLSKELVVELIPESKDLDKDCTTLEQKLPEVRKGLTASIKDIDQYTIEKIGAIDALIKKYYAVKDYLRSTKWNEMN